MNYFKLGTNVLRSIIFKRQDIIINVRQNGFQQIRHALLNNDDIKIVCKIKFIL